MEDDTTCRPVGRIDQYELVRELGGGGFGCVYLAKDTVARIAVAVKGLPPDVRHNKEELENIRENFALVSRLHHPNIAAALVLHPVSKTFYATRGDMEKLRVFDGDTLMVMEYAPGCTLSSWRKRFPGKRVPLATAVDIVRQVASALDYAHERGVLHRDVKPANVMIETLEDGRNVIRVLDFGLAAEIRSSMGRVSREIRDMSGTRPYMAPEQWAGEKQGPATDQYALAVLFCELVSGSVPYQSVFESGDTVAMMANVIRQPVRLPESLPDAVRKPLLKALSKKPADRYPSCAAFVDALERPPWPKLALIVGILLGAVVAALAWRLSQRPAMVSGDETEHGNLPLTAQTNAVPAPVSLAPTNVIPASVQPAPTNVTPVHVQVVQTNAASVSARTVVTNARPVSVPSAETGAVQIAVVRPAPPVAPPTPPVVEKFPLSRAYAAGKEPYGTDYGKEFRRLMRKAAQGDADAQFCVGWLYDKGLGVGASPVQARHYWQKSAAKGNPYAVQALEKED